MTLMYGIEAIDGLARALTVGKGRSADSNLLYSSKNNDFEKTPSIVIFYNNPGRYVEKSSVRNPRSGLLRKVHNPSADYHENIIIRRLP